MFIGHKCLHEPTEGFSTLSKLVLHQIEHTIASLLGKLHKLPRFVVECLKFHLLDSLMPTKKGSLSLGAHTSNAIVYWYLMHSFLLVHSL